MSEEIAKNYRDMHAKAVAAYEANVPAGYRYSDVALKEAINAAVEHFAATYASEDYHARLSEAVKVLEYYSGVHEPALTRPNEGPWGVNSDDFGQKAREFLATLGEEA